MAFAPASPRSLGSVTYFPQSNHARPIFQPPPSPSAATPIGANTTSSDYFSPRSLKRARPDSSHGRETPSYLSFPTPSDGMCDSGIVNERYKLADGFDTPGFLAQSNHESNGEQWGRARICDSDPRHLEVHRAGLHGPLARERNGVARMASSPNGSPDGNPSWAGFAFGLVGRVFTFGTSVIKGFYAGSGPGYDLTASSAATSHASRSSNAWNRPRLQRAHTPVPGAWNDDDFLGDFEQDNPHSSPSLAARPAYKRRQTDKESWVVIGTPDMPDSPRLRREPAGTRSSLAPQPTISRATSTRRSIAPIRRTSSVTHTGSPALQHSSPDRRASVAPLRPSPSRPSSAASDRRGSLTSANANAKDNWPSPEALRFVRRQAKQGKAADKAMSSMSKRLEDLIRQGQQALGTKVEVEESETGELDEGFVDEDEDEW